MRSYLEGAFSGSSIPSHEWVEQAGLILRIILEARGGYVVAWPSLRRCAHVGIHGYHRPTGHRFAGTLEERITKLRESIITTEILRNLCKDEPQHDIQTLADIPFWTAQDLRVVQRFF